MIFSRLPGGKVAMTVHRDDYAQLGRAHDGAHRFAAERGLALAAPRWEIYGHGHDNPERAGDRGSWLVW